MGSYLELTKPRALVVIVFTTCMGFLLAEPVDIRLNLMFHLALGVTLSGAGSLALNQYLERERDLIMERTKGRPIPSGRVKASSALIFGLLLSLVGYAYLWLLLNPLCSGATMLCGVSYVLWYTPLKYKTTLSSFVGALPGALLPVMGWAASQNRIELGGWVLFTILFLWQIPHALIISIRHREDYQNAGMKQLPVVTSQNTSVRHILLNTALLIPVTVIPSFINMAQGLYGSFAVLSGFTLLIAAIHYAFDQNDIRARRLFIGLSAYLPLLLLVMVMDQPGP